MTDKIDLSELLKSAVNSQLMDIHTCLPAIVETYNRENQTCSVQPAIKRSYQDGSVNPLPIIKNVPVTFHRNGTQFLHFDLKKGDVVTLVFSERSTDKWKEKGGVVQPDDKRKFHLTDAFALPGGYPKPTPMVLKGEDGDIELTSGDNYFMIKKDGKIKVLNSSVNIEMDAEGNFKVSNESGEMKMSSGGKFVFTNNTEELVSIFSEFIQSVIDSTNETAVGPLPMSAGSIAAMTAIKGRLDTLKE